MTVPLYLFHRQPYGKAGTAAILQAFGAYYLRLLATAAAFVTVIALMLIVLVNAYAETLSGTDWVILCCYILAAILIVSFVTLATIGKKIYSVSRINAADVRVVNI